MTSETYHPRQELKKIPKHIWAKMPTWKTSGMAFTDYTHCFNKKNLKLSETYDTVAKRKFKTEETFNYVKDNAHKFSLTYLKVGDSFVFDKLNSYYLDELTVNRVSPLNTGNGQLVSIKKSNISSTQTWMWSHHFRLLGKLWNKLRIEALEGSLSETILLKKEVKVTNALIHVGTNTTKLLNELEAFRNKITNLTLTQGDLSDMWFHFEKFNSENKKWKTQLPKTKVGEDE